ncbi:hypothetical protein GCM10023192_58960 [Amycolatopsis samaneae]
MASTALRRPLKRQVIRGVERPNVALGALDAANVAFGALDAPNAAFGALGFLAEDTRGRASARPEGPLQDTTHPSAEIRECHIEGL